LPTRMTLLKLAMVESFAKGDGVRAAYLLEFTEHTFRRLRIPNWAFPSKLFAAAEFCECGFRRSFTGGMRS